MTKQEADKFIIENMETSCYPNSTIEHTYLEIDKVYALIDLIIDNNIKGSFNNNTNCIINLS
jgi:hypothetical protein